ncbi:superoxide dismutase [Nocardia sp. 2]|uniref:Superoxide dismutase n=1 Tax=Nocardia acididurans TaxID=2802282 RepID=A0ABS1MG34_9NOCA|nr:superoxide dismutase [Nocardia acididurans]
MSGCSDTPAAQDDSTSRAQISPAFDLPEQRAYPEGIAVDARNGDVYVGSFTTGAIYRRPAGRARAEIFLPAGTDGRHTANGLRVDSRGRLWVIDHTTGVTVYDTGTRAPVARFDAPRQDQPFLNDLAFTPDGSAYLTDSVRPVIYRVTPELFDGAAARGGRETLPVYADLTTATTPGNSTPMLLNGIVADPAGRYLLTVDMAGGGLYRVEIADAPGIARVDLRGGDMIDGDGMELLGDTLWVVHNRSNSLSRWSIGANGTTAELRNRLTDEILRIPTTVAHDGDQMLVVSSQFDRGGPMGEGTPVDPFTVFAVRGL